MLEYVDLATARAASGTRIIASALVASPWSEAAKGLFVVAKLPAYVVARGRDGSEATAWTGIDNVPVVVHDADPPRSNWAAIVGLASRLAGPGVLLPDGVDARAEAMGTLELLAGEDGLAWTARHAMILASLDGRGGFPIPVAEFLARRYGRPTDAQALRARIAAQLDALARRLAGEYFGGERPNAVDVYAATFLTPLSVIEEAHCPQMIEPLRRAFGAAQELLGDLVPATLWAHRTRMFERHLTWPIRLA